MRDLNIRGLVFLVAALVLALLTGVALYGVAQQANTKPASATAPTVAVVVAASDIPVRTTLTAELVGTKQYPADLVPAGAFTNTADAIGRTATSPISAGQAIVQAQLASATGSRGAGLAIEKGRVLVAFPTNDPLTAAGLVNVGDHVDILATVTQGTSESAKVSQTTIQNLEVVDLLSGAPTRDANGKEQAARPTALVFTVDHEVALVMKYLRDSQASVDITVRSRAESELAKTTAVDLNFLVKTYGFR